MKRRELETQLQDLFEDRITGPGLERLEDELRSSPEAREAYCDYARLHNLMELRAEGVDVLNVIPMDRIVERRQRRSLNYAGLAAVAVLVLIGVVMAVILTRTPEPTLRFATSPGTDLEMSHQLAGEEAPQGQILEPGSRLQVRLGTVELEFASGVRGIVHGPADLTLRDEGLLELDRGTAWFEVPSKASGFQVNTPDLILIDLGTEFGIRSRPDFLDEVHVFTGKVELRSLLGLKKGALLVAGQARVAGPEGRWQEIPLRRDHFLTELPDTEAESTLLFTDSFEAAKALSDWNVGGTPTTLGRPGVPGTPSQPRPGGSTLSVSSPWVEDGDFGSNWVEAGQFRDPMPDGDIFAWSNGPGHLSHTLSDTLQANTTYTLTVATGWRADIAEGIYPVYPGYGIELRAGDNLLASDYDKNHGGTGTGPAAGTWKDVRATYTTGASVTPGQHLEIRLIGYGGQTNYDHVRLEASPVR